MAQGEEGVIVTDSDWQILHANEAAGRLLGTPSKNLVGHSIRSTFVVNAMNVGAEMLRELQAGREVRMRRELSQPHGKPLLVDAFWQPLEDGRLRGTLLEVVNHRDPMVASAS